MKIAICGSRSFIKEMKEIASLLSKLGHEVVLPPSARKEKCPRMDEDFNKFLKLKQEYAREHFDAIKECDAILVCNFDKHGIKNYVGGNTLVEAIFAWYHGKRIFFLHDLPKELPYYEELVMIEPIIIGGKEKLTKFFSELKAGEIKK